jgi:1-acyl-sn-glycerol-3-phosphate acyltransferase
LIELRAAFRLARVGLHLLWGAATVALVYPWSTLAFRRALKRRWSRQLVGMLGLRLDKVGPGGTVHGLLVANHISWLDIFVINALAPAAFVSKDDVRAWPLIGWLCSRTETIFLARGSRAAAQETRERMIADLRAGTPVAVFPEGTTTGGERLLPFHAALFQGAIDAGVPVMPLALRYLAADGRPSRAPAYDGDVTLWESLREIVRSAGLTAQLRVLAPLPSADLDRRHLAARCHQTIAFHLGHSDAMAGGEPIASPSAGPTGRRASGTPGGLPAGSPSGSPPTDSPNPAPAACPTA